MSEMLEKKMKRSRKFSDCLICPICSRIRVNSVAVNDCMHSFCRSCITKKFTEEYLRNCPICDTYLGASPLDHLKPDCILQAFAADTFSSFEKITKKCRVSEVEAEEREVGEGEEDEEEEPEKPSIPKLARRKERSLSSILNNETSQTGKRKPIPKKFPSYVSSQALLLEDDSPESSASPTLRGRAHNKQQLNLQRPKKQAKEKSAEESQPTVVIDLDSMAEAVDPMEIGKPSSKGIVFKTPESSTIHTDKPIFYRGKGKEPVDVSNYIIIDDDDDKGHEPAPEPPVSEQPKRRPRGRPRKAMLPPSAGLKISAQAVLDATANLEKMPTFLWFSLIASNSCNAGPPLPQIPSTYLRIKDHSDNRAQVSSIKKYLVQKLNLESEDEVEIEFLGLKIPDHMELYKLLGLRSSAIDSSGITTSVGSSGKDFVTVLNYSRKV